MAANDHWLGVPDHWTLEDLARSRQVVVFECRFCAYSRTLDITELAREHGPMTRAAYLKRNYACLRCGKTGSD